MLLLVTCQKLVCPLLEWFVYIKDAFTLTNAYPQSWAKVDTQTDGALRSEHFTRTLYLYPINSSTFTILRHYACTAHVKSR